MPKVAGKRINPAQIISAEVESRHYMNGSAHWLVVKLANGETIRQEHGWGFDAWDTLGKIDAATSMAEATKTL